MADITQNTMEKSNNFTGLDLLIAGTLGALVGTALAKSGGGAHHYSMPSHYTQNNYK